MPNRCRHSYKNGNDRTIDCEENETKCLNCGWYPPVEEMRIEEIRESMRKEEEDETDRSDTGL